MAGRLPLVVVAGQLEQLQAGDTILGGTVVGGAVLDFGAFPGSANASVAVTGQGPIVSGSQVEAWLSLETATTDHTTDEHRVENMKVLAGTISAGTGFTIYGEAENPVRALVADGNRLYGKWTVNWRWQ